MFFAQKVDGRSRRAIAQFLAGHYRYDTMRSWNAATSYAHCIKLHHLDLPKAIEERAWDVVMADDDYWIDIRQPVRRFTKEWGGRYTIARNGRSGGYLVLYNSQWHDTGYKSKCWRCGQMNYQPVTAGHDRCGRCGELRFDLEEPFVTLQLAPGQSLDRGITEEEFMEWPIWQLRERLRLVRAFDEACDDLRANFIRFVRLHEVVDDVIVEKRPVRVFRPVESREQLRAASAS